MSSTPSETLRFRWLDALLPDVPFDGWTEAAAAVAADRAGLTPGEQALAAPNGISDLIDAFFDRAGQAALGIAVVIVRRVSGRIPDHVGDAPGALHSRARAPGQQAPDGRTAHGFPVRLQHGEPGQKAGLDPAGRVQAGEILLRQVFQRGLPGRVKAPAGCAVRWLDP